jgi:hypothetical protein
MDKVKKHWWLITIGVLMVMIATFVAWALIIPSPMPQALDALQSDSQVYVTTYPWLVFQPVQQIPTTGLIFYPGGRVDPRAYAPSAHAMASKGYLIVIVPMPLNLAVLGAERASLVIQNYTDIQSWVIGGHSLGGSMAASFSFNHPNQIKGLILWASYPPSSDDLSDSAIKVTSIYASLDGLATPEKINTSRHFLPPDTTWVQIEGGNHAQFGWYGAQSGDNPAIISREKQQELVISATLDLLQRVDQTP